MTRLLLCLATEQNNISCMYIALRAVIRFIMVPDLLVIEVVVSVVMLVVIVIVVLVIMVIDIAVFVVIVTKEVSIVVILQPFDMYSAVIEDTIEQVVLFSLHVDRETCKIICTCTLNIILVYLFLHY